MHDGAAAGRPAVVPCRGGGVACPAPPCGPWAAPRRRARRRAAGAAGRRWPEGWREGADRGSAKPCRERIVSCLATPVLWTVRAVFLARRTRAPGPSAAQGGNSTDGLIEVCPLRGPWPGRMQSLMRRRPCPALAPSRRCRPCARRQAALYGAIAAPAGRGGRGRVRLPCRRGRSHCGHPRLGLMGPPAPAPPLPPPRCARLLSGPPVAPP